MVSNHLRFYLGLIAASLLATLGALAALAAMLSVSAGMGPVVITSDSMQPSLSRGDLVIGRPYDGSWRLGAGTVVIFHNSPDSGLITHRIVGTNTDRSYQTKGDANQVPDSTPVAAADIEATGRFVVPLIGLPTAWARSGEWFKVALAGFVTVLMMWLARFGLINRYCPWFAHDDSDAGTGSDTQSGQPGPDEDSPTMTCWGPPDPSALRDGPRLVAARADHRSTAYSDRLTPTRVLLVGAVLAMLTLPSATAAMTSASTNGSNSWTAAAAFNAFASRYLKTDGPGNRNSVAILPLNTTAPTVTTLPNYDQNRDSAAGLLITKGGSGDTETDLTKVQRWSETFSTSTTLTGTGLLTFFSAIKNFDTTKRGEVTAYLRDCLANGTGCTTFDTASVNQDNWQQGSGTWVAKIINFGTINRTITAGRALQIVVIVGNTAGDDMWFAYDTTAYTSVFTIT